MFFIALLILQLKPNSHQNFENIYHSPPTRSNMDLVHLLLYVHDNLSEKKVAKLLKNLLYFVKDLQISQNNSDHFTHFLVFFNLLPFSLPIIQSRYAVV